LFVGLAREIERPEVAPRRRAVEDVGEPAGLQTEGEALRVDERGHDWCLLRASRASPVARNPLARSPGKPAASRRPRTAGSRWNGTEGQRWCSRWSWLFDQSGRSGESTERVSPA